MFSLEKPQQHEAEHILVDALDIAANYWDHPDNTHLIHQLAGHLHGNVAEGDFNEAADHFQALTLHSDVSLLELADHYDAPPTPYLREIRENEIVEDLTAATNRILTNAGHKGLTQRRLHTLLERFNDMNRTARAA